MIIVILVIITVVIVEVITSSNDNSNINNENNKNNNDSSRMRIIDLPAQSGRHQGVSRAGSSCMLCYIILPHQGCYSIVRL